MGISYLEEVNEVLQQANAHLVQVFKQLIKHRNEVCARQLLTKYIGKMMNWERQCSPHFPLSANTT